jgi:hypothetical protein
LHTKQANPPSIDAAKTGMNSFSSPLSYVAISQLVLLSSVASYSNKLFSACRMLEGCLSRPAWPECQPLLLAYLGQATTPSGPSSYYSLSTGSATLSCSLFPPAVFQVVHGSRVLRAVLHKLHSLPDTSLIPSRVYFYFMARMRPQPTHASQNRHPQKATHRRPQNPGSVRRPSFSSHSPVERKHSSGPRSKSAAGIPSVCDKTQSQNTLNLETYHHRQLHGRLNHWPCC